MFDFVFDFGFDFDFNFNFNVLLRVVRRGGPSPEDLDVAAYTPNRAAAGAACVAADKNAAQGFPPL